MRRVKKDEIFTVELDEMAAAGYQWRFVAQSNLEVRGITSQIQDEQAVGGAVTKIFFMQAKETGEYELVFELVRPWEKKNPVRHHHEHIDVSEDR